MFGVPKNSIFSGGKPIVKTFFGCGRGQIKGQHGKNCIGRKKCQGMPLSKKSRCGRAKVCGINGDRKHCARLASLGVYPGNEIELVSPAEGENGIIKVHGGNVSIDKETMDNILVSE